MLFRRAVAGLAKEETVKPVQNDLAALNAEEDAKLERKTDGEFRTPEEWELIADVKRLRGEVRRLRRVIRTPRVLEDYSVCRYCGAGVPLDVDARISHHPGCIAEAALAPRRGSK